MNKFIFIPLFVFCISSIAAMDRAAYEYRLATEDDLDALVHMTREEVNNEEGMIAIPGQFIQPALMDSMKQGGLFVVSDGERIVGLKKLFLLNDPDKKKDVLENIIQCSGENAEHIYRGTISYDDITASLQYNLPTEKAEPAENPAYLFTSGDFTQRSFRGRGLNTALMRMAFEAIKAKTIAHVKEQKNDALVVVFGIAENNGAFDLGAPHDRTNAIMRLFVPFARDVARATGHATTVNTVAHDRWTSFMPTFDQEADVLTPIESDVVGAGVVLSFPLKHE